MSSERDKLRETIIKDTELLATKQRFALFSQPVPLGLGDDSYDFKLPHPRTADGKPVTEPPNVKVAHPKSGKVKSSYFSVQNYTTIGDPYLDHSRIKLQEELKKMELQSNKDAVFKPASGYKELVSGAFPHMADFDAKPTKNYKTPDGRVWSAPKNITTNPYSKQMQKFREHQKDEYERAREMERQRLLEAKRKEKEQPFRSTIAGGENFNRDKQVYGIDKLPPKSQRKERDLSAKRTDVPPFRPSNPPKKGYNGYMNKIVYMQDPEQIKKRVDKEKTKEAFRPNNLGTLSRPTPTISCYKTNIRRQMSAKGF